MDLERLTAELAGLEAFHQHCQVQTQAWTNDALRTEGKMQYVTERIQQLQGEQAQAAAEKAAAEAARVEAEAKAAEAATGAYPVRGDEPTVPQDAVSDASENGHLDAEFGDPDQHPSEEVIYRQTA